MPKGEDHEASGLTFRTATAEDLPGIVALLADDDAGRLREDASLPLDPNYVAAFEAIQAEPNQELIVAELDGALAGTMQLTYLPGLGFRGAWHGQIESVRIASALRGQGLGTVMLEWAVERSRARGCRIVQLMSHNSRLAAHRFYERLGWDKSHSGFKMKL